MINMDMVGRLRECRLFVESRETAAGLSAAVELANPYVFLRRAPPGSRAAGNGARAITCPSSTRTSPGLFLFTGLHDDYHRPSDDPPTLNYRGLGAVAGFAEALVRGIARRART